MRVIYRIKTGWPSKLTTQLKRAISHYSNNASAFRIGITNWPERRAGQYRQHGWDYDEMIVLYETSTRTNAVSLEQKLIRHNWHKDTLEVERDGGGGRHGKGWYYLYVALRRS